MAEIRVNSTGGVKLYDADDSHYAQIKAGTVTSNTDVLELGSGAVVAGTKVDLNGQELILDADADTSITADTDDQIDVRIAGADDFRFTANTFTAQSGSSIVVPDGGLTFGSTAITSTAAELNILDGVTATAAELNILDGVTATAAEINLIDGNTARGTTAIADGDGVLINDAGTMRQTTVETLKTYIGDNTPAFAVRKTDGNQSYSQNTWTKVTFNTELLDTDNAFASNKFTVPTGKAGTYLFNVAVQMGSIGSGSAYEIKLYVNGSAYTTLVQHATSATETPIYGGVQAIDLSADDYVEVFGLTNGGAGNFTNNLCQFTGFKLGA